MGKTKQDKSEKLEKNSFQSNLWKATTYFKQELVSKYYIFERKFAMRYNDRLSSVFFRGYPFLECSAASCVFSLFNHDLFIPLRQSSRWNYNSTEIPKW